MMDSHLGREFRSWIVVHQYKAALTCLVSCFVLSLIGSGVVIDSIGEFRIVKSVSAILIVPFLGSISVGIALTNQAPLCGRQRLPVITFRAIWGIGFACAGLAASCAGLGSDRSPTATAVIRNFCAGLVVVLILFLLGRLEIAWVTLFSYILAAMLFSRPPRSEQTDYWAFAIEAQTSTGELWLWATPATALLLLVAIRPHLIRASR